MGNPFTGRRHSDQARSTSPQLLRSRSGTSALTLPENRASSVINTSQRLAGNRSKSTTRSRLTQRNEENINPATIIASMQKKAPNHDHQDQSRDGFVRFLQRGSTTPRNSSATKGYSKPSAWALSPGRSSPLAVAPEPPQRSSCGTTGAVRSKSKGVGGVSGVLKYFRQKKVSPIQEEEYHRFRVFYNRILQWRFVNARAEVAMAAVKIDAQV